MSCSPGKGCDSVGCDDCLTRSLGGSSWPGADLVGLPQWGPTKGASSAGCSGGCGCGKDCGCDECAVRSIGASPWPAVDILGPKSSFASAIARSAWPGLDVVGPVTGFVKAMGGSGFRGARRGASPHRRHSSVSGSDPWDWLDAEVEDAIDDHEDSVCRWCRENPDKCLTTNPSLYERCVYEEPSADDPCFDMDVDDCPIDDFRGVFFSEREQSCEPFALLFCNAYRIIVNNFDIIEQWFDVVGQSGRAFERHFNGRTKTVFQCGGVFCDILSIFGMGVPPGVLICDDYLRVLQAVVEDEGEDDAKWKCFLIDLAAVIVHETYHVTFHSSEKKAFGLEAWFKVKGTERMCMVGVPGCCATFFPEDGSFVGDATFDELPGLVPSFNACD